MHSVIATGTLVAKLELEYARCMRVNSEELDLEPAVYLQEGSELMAQLKDELALLPELLDLSPECDITKADVGEPGSSTDTQNCKLRGILERHRKIFLGDGNAAPAPARGRWRRIRAHQERDEYLSEIRDFLRGNLERFSPKRLRRIAKVADLFALDVRYVLYRLARSTRDQPRDAEDQLRLVVSEALREDMLHYAHEDVQGGHQGITRTYEKLRSEFYWPGMYAGVEHYEKECTDCASGRAFP
ncbi:hypothetical protein PF003_g37493 [Phytophthora fragariae]|nr:hypothetical protein PF003_g37493 [Phytophthora fragariae]